MTNNNSSKIEQFINWRNAHISDRQFILLLSFIVGFLAAVSGLILHWLIAQIEWLLTSRFSRESFNWLYLVFPVIGIYLTSLFVKYVVKDEISHGITRILYAISAKKSKLKRHNTWTSIVASALTIGFGGSVGAEAPIVLTGSAIGSNLGQLFKMRGRTLMLLVGCGASAAIAGVFKAPMAGLVFTVEVLLIGLTMSSLLPILIASVTATCFTYFFIGSDSLFHFTLDNTWVMERILPNIILGIVCGLISFYFIRMMTLCENGFHRLKNKRYAKLLIGGFILSSLIFLFPSLYGEGYSSINILLNGNTESDWQELLNNSLFYGNERLLILYVALVLFTKVFATSATNGSGGCGGTFAPSLFIGAFAGFLFARIWNMYDFAGIYVPEKNFALVGMAGVMAGIMHAPLTGIFLIAELTGGYQLFIPLIIVSISSYLTIYIFEPHSIYGMRLARQGKLITHNTDQSILTLMSVSKTIDKDFTAIAPDTSLAVLIKKISNSKTSILPVVDSGGRLIGEVDLYKIRHIVFRTELYHHFIASQLMSQPPALIGENDKMEDVMKIFEKTSAEQLPVVTTDRQLLGYIDRTKMYSVYRQLVADYSTD